MILFHANRFANENIGSIFKSTRKLILENQYAQLKESLSPNFRTCVKVRKKHENILN